MEDEFLDYYDQIEQCKENLRLLKSENGVPLRIAQVVVALTTYWDHPSGSLVHASKHLENVEYGRYGYAIKFGRNYFLVGLAIERCVATIHELLDLFRESEEYSYDELLKRLYLNVCGAVANYEEEEYRDYYPIEGNYLKFGTQWINVVLLANFILEISDIEKMYKF